jgi:hypothetical protein
MRHHIVFKGILKMRTVASRRSISSIFCRKGGEGHFTMLFENLPVPARRSLETKVGFSDGEKPVVAFFESDDSWCLLTNHRVVWHDLASQYEVGIMELRRVSHDMHVSVQRDELDRSLWRDLNIETTDGRKLSLQMEPGRPFIGLWSALHWLCGWAEKRRQTGVAA